MTEPVRFDTKIVVVVRADLPTWQKLNMTAYLASGVAADADGTAYLAMFGQPTLVFETTGAELTRTLDRALARDVRPAIFTEDLFETGHDAANRAAVAAVPRDGLVLTGLAFRCDRKNADKITKGLRLHS
jgi:hypothetical protein